MIDLHAATVLLQVAAGGMFFLWITTRRREVSLGYGWLLRGMYAVLATFGLIAAFCHHAALASGDSWNRLRGLSHWPRWCCRLCVAVPVLKVSVKWWSVAVRASQR